MYIKADLLPAEILLEIFSYCTLDDVATSIPFVCSWWTEVSRVSCLWKGRIFTPPRTMDRARILNLLNLSPQLQAVDFSKRYVRAEVIEPLMEYCPNLEKLCAPWEGFRDLIKYKITTKFDNLKILIFTGTEVKYNAFEYLINNFPRLEHFEFKDLYFTKNDLVVFLQNKQVHLQTLALRCCTSDGHCILPFISNCAEIKTLSVRNLCDHLRHLTPAEMPKLLHVTSLTFEISSLISVGNYLRNISFFPNIIELQLSICPVFNKDFFSVVACNCPKLQKLTVRGCASLLEDDSLGHVLCLKKLTSLSICNNPHITDKGVYQLGGISELTNLELYDCKKLTAQCLTVICCFNKLKVLKFDLQHSNVPVDLMVSRVNSATLHLMFYNCEDVTMLECFRKQRFRVNLLDDKNSSFGASLLL